MVGSAEEEWFLNSRKLLFDTKKNTVHPKLVKTQFGFHIIKVTDKKMVKMTKFADNKEEIKNRMTRELRGTLLEELKKVRKNRNQ